MEFMARADQTMAVKMLHGKEERRTEQSSNQGYTEQCSSHVYLRNVVCGFGLDVR